MKMTMKNLWMPVVGILTILAACKKQDLQTEENTQEIRATGLLPDDPARVAKVPLIVSRDYLMKTAAAATGKGKGGGGNTGGTTTTTTTDVTPPNVAITNPGNASKVSGTVNITGTASDNVGVTSISVTVNGALIGSGSGTTFNVAWNTANYADGVYTIQVVAKDAAGNTGSSAVSVTKNTQVIVNPPSATEVSLATPAVQNQGNEGSCVAFGVGYSARSIHYYYQNGASSFNLSSNVFSPEFLYNQTKFGTDCMSGTSVTVALDFIVNNGICTWGTMPYSGSNGCAGLPSASQASEALNYKISGYSRLLTSDMQAIKSMINAKRPVIIMINADNSFVNAKAGFVWRTYSGSGSLPHCITIVGYDDAKNAYKVMNSWGTTWADSGYSWIDYNFLPTKSGTYSYIIN